LAVFSICCLGCDSQQLGHRLPYIENVSETASTALELYDTNHDGTIKGIELEQSPGLKASLGVLDTDIERGITAKCLEKRFQEWDESRVGRTKIICTITKNHEPLPGAIVKFVPEPFFTKEFKRQYSHPLIGVGETNGAGIASISWPTTPGPGGDPPGIGPGMYRVEITKDGETIPAKYNTATEIGQEISVDNAELPKGLKYDLNY
jgi:hypothetical protein